MKLLLGVIFVVLLLNFTLCVESKQDFGVFSLVNYDKKLLQNDSFDGYLMSEKLDGVRAIWNGKQLLSRSGKEFSPPKCWLESLPEFGLDGELFIARGKFEEVLSVVSKQQHKCEECACKEWQQIGYFIFDVPNACEYNTTPSLQSNTSENPKSCTLLERLSLLEKWLVQKNTNKLDSSASLKTPLHIIPQEIIPNQKALESRLKDITKNGGEGLVIRKNNAPYEKFRTNNAMKLKDYKDAECKVVAHHLGKGKYANSLGSLTCEQNLAQNPANILAKDSKILFKIGSGFSNKDRENPPPIGSIITYKYYGLTKNGLPRFPVFLRIYTPQ